MSTSQVTYPIVAALVAAEAELGSNRTWYPKNPQQEAFLTEVFGPVRGEVESGIDCLRREYSLAGNLLSIKGVLDLLVKWVKEGTEVTIRRDEQEWEGVRLTGKNARVSFRGADGHGHPIVVLPTQSDDVLYMTVLDEPPEPLELRSLATHLVEEGRRSLHTYGAVRFPMVDLRHNNDVDWITGIETNTMLNGGGDVPVIMTSVTQETKLRMNKVGAHVKSEFRGEMVITARARRIKPDYEINRPFLVIFTRPSLSQPLAVLYVTEEDWKNPGTLDFD